MPRDMTYRLRKNFFSDLRFGIPNALISDRGKQYSNSQLEKTLKNMRIQDKEVKEGHEVLVFNFMLKLFPEKLKTRWYGPYTVSRVFPYGIVEVFGNDGIRFKVDGHRLNK
nr:hypothetical protein [Tanacetum cinerariifolium]